MHGTIHHYYPLFINNTFSHIFHQIFFRYLLNILQAIYSQVLREKGGFEHLPLHFSII